MPILWESRELWPFACNSLKTGNKQCDSKQQIGSRSKKLRPMSAGRSSRPLLIVCLGSLQAFATGLDRISRDLDLDSAPEASLVYDRHNNVIFSFASEDRTNIPLSEVSEAMVAAVLGGGRR